MKKCTKCEEYKPLSLFKKDNRNLDGCGAQCKKCHVLSCLEYQKRSIAFHEYQKQYRTLPKEKLRRLQWRRSNLDVHAKDEKKRRRALSAATPRWLSEEQLNEMKALYALAKELSWLSDDRLVVDHIMPLRGKKSCGLHVPWNLQIIPNKVNCSKSNNEGRVNL